MTSALTSLVTALVLGATALAPAAIASPASASASATVSSVAAAAGPVIEPFPEGLTRLSGADRYAVSVQIARKYAPGVPVAYVAKGSDFPDALSAAAAAALEGGPLLLTPTNQLHPSVAAALRDLQPERIVVVGGTGSVSASVFTELQRIAPTQRIGGVDRYEASRNITGTAFLGSEKATTEVFLATGRTFADALAASGAAGKAQAPVVLVDGTRSTVPQATLDLLKDLEATTISIAGGAASVSSGIEGQLRSAGYTVQRYGGADRYAVAAGINAAYFEVGTTTGFFATGLTFPDALSGAALAGRLGAPLYVTSPACLPEPVRSGAAALGLTTRVVLGGTSSVSATAAAGTGCLTSAAPSISGTARVGYSLTANAGSWTPGTTLSYQWLANGAAISGATGPTLSVTTAYVNKTLSVRVTGTQPGYTTVARVSSATARIAYPDRTPPASFSTCPAWAPIKGNQNSKGEWIYHLPTGRDYAKTDPEECFRTEAAARAAGYRASKV